MGDHLVLYVGRLIGAEAVEPVPPVEVPEPSGQGCASHTILPSGDDGNKVELAVPEEEELLIQTVECRICQEEDNIKNLDTPCTCSGSLKFAHKVCLQRWINEKGDLTCEICHEPYKPGYIEPPRVHPDETTIDISGGWTISGTPLDLHDPRLLAMAAAQRHFLEAEDDDIADSNASGAVFCRSVALILIALLLLRHALTVTNDGGDDNASTLFSIFLLHAAGFILPCYIMAWAVSILQRRRQSQEAAALAATEVAFILQAGQRRGLQFTVVPESASTPQQAPPHQ